MKAIGVKSFLPSNRNPRSYTWEHVQDALIEKGEPDAFGYPHVRLGNETTAEWKNLNPLYTITVRLKKSEIIRLYSDGTIWLNDRGYKTKMTKQRMDAALQGIGKRLLSREDRGGWKIYTISNGEYADYWNGMVVQPSVDNGGRINHGNDENRL